MSGIACLAFFSFACTPAQKTTEPEEINYISYVDPYIGSGEHGHVFVGANVPFGMIQAGPQNIHKGWDWCSGYHYTDSVIIGFSERNGLCRLGRYPPDALFRRSAHGAWRAG